MRILTIIFTVALASTSYAQPIYKCVPANPAKMPVGTSYSLLIAKAAGKKYHLKLSIRGVRPGSEPRDVVWDAVKYESHDNLSIFTSIEEDMIASVNRQIRNDGTYNGVLHSEVISAELKCVVPANR